MFIFLFFLFCSALDAESERVVQEALERVQKGTIFFFLFYSFCLATELNMEEYINFHAFANFSQQSGLVDLGL